MRGVLQRRVAGRLRPEAAIPVLLLVTAVLLWVSSRGHYLLDTRVYAAGGEAVLHGRDPYGVLEPTARLVFTYTPFAALLMAPLSALMQPVLLALWTALNVTALLGIIALLTGRAGGWARVCGLALLALLLEPVRETFAFGQVNLFLMLLVLLDQKVVPPRWRGCLTGLAAAVKLTPLIFLPYYAVTRQWRKAANLVAAFVGLAALAWAVLPGPSLAFWTGYLRDTSRVGSTAYANNQSLSGLVARLERQDFPHGAGLLLLLAAVALLGIELARRLHPRDPLLATVTVAMTGLLVSPISWSHHWVWLCAVPLVAAPAMGPRVRLGFLLVVLAAPFAYLPRHEGREYGWSLWQQLAGNLYVWAGIGYLLLVALHLSRRRPVDAGRPREPASRASAGVAPGRRAASTAAGP